MPTWYNRFRSLLPLAFIALIGKGAPVSVPDITKRVPAASDAVAECAKARRSFETDEPAQIREVCARLPLTFEANTGQFDPGTRFMSRGNGRSLFLSPEGATMVFSKVVPGQGKKETSRDTRTSKGMQPPRVSQSAIRMIFAGASRSCELTGVDELVAKSNYFVGDDPARWRTNVKNYSRVRYTNLYPGVDLLFYGNQERLECDFVVSAGTDPSVIKLKFEGSRRMRIDSLGDLVLTAAGTQIRIRKPIVYQEIDGVRHQLSGGYTLRRRRLAGFRVGKHSSSQPLVIDPILAYSTYLGGSQSDEGNAIAVDQLGNAYLTGFILSSDFPVTPGAFSTHHKEFGSFVTKINLAGSTLIYSTYLGGTTGSDSGAGIAVDAGGNAYITGTAMSTDFPTTAGAFSTEYNGGINDAFVTKLNPTGSALVYSTYVGGRGDDEGLAIAVDAEGSAYITGVTASEDPFASFPTTAGAFQTVYGGGFTGDGDAFVTKLNPSGTALVYSTYLGGGGSDLGNGIAVDSAGDAYVCGTTSSTNFPVTAGALQGSMKGKMSAFVTKLNGAGSSAVFSTYLGGSSFEAGKAIKLDKDDNIYLAGFSNSADFPATPVGFHTAIGPRPALFVAKLDPAAEQIMYFTVLGGSDLDILNGMAIDSAGNAYITGRTYSRDFPITPSAFQPVHSAGYTDAFVTKLNPNGTALVYSSFFGGSGLNSAGAIAVDSFGDAYLTGNTTSLDFPTTPNAFQPKLSQPAFAQQDAFIARIRDTFGPRIREVAIAGKNLSINGESFDAGSVILMNGQEQKTLHDDQNPTTLLIGKKLRNKIDPGAMVTLQVRNSDSSLSNEVNFTRPQ